MASQGPPVFVNANASTFSNSTTQAMDIDTDQYDDDSSPPSPSMSSTTCSLHELDDGGKVKEDYAIHSGFTTIDAKDVSNSSSPAMSSRGDEMGQDGVFLSRKNENTLQGTKVEEKGKGKAKESPERPGPRWDGPNVLADFDFDAFLREENVPSDPFFPSAEKPGASNSQAVEDYQRKLMPIGQQNHKRLVAERQDTPLSRPAQNTMGTVPLGITNNQALQDYQMQLLVLDCGNKNRKMMKRIAPAVTAEVAQNTNEPVITPSQEQQIQMRILEEQSRNRASPQKEPENRDGTAEAVPESSDSIPKLDIPDYYQQLMLLEEQNRRRRRFDREQEENITQERIIGIASPERSSLPEPPRKIFTLKAAAESGVSISRPGTTDYHSQMQLLEEQNRRRITMAVRQQQENIGKAVAENRSSLRNSPREMAPSRAVPESSAQNLMNPAPTLQDPYTQRKILSQQNKRHLLTTRSELENIGEAVMPQTSTSSAPMRNDDYKVQLQMLEEHNLERQKQLRQTSATDSVNAPHVDQPTGEGMPNSGKSTELHRRRPLPESCFTEEASNLEQSVAENDNHRLQSDTQHPKSMFLINNKQNSMLPPPFVSGESGRCTEDRNPSPALVSRSNEQQQLRPEHRTMLDMHNQQIRDWAKKQRDASRINKEAQPVERLHQNLEEKSGQDNHMAVESVPLQFRGEMIDKQNGQGHIPETPQIGQYDWLQYQLKMQQEQALAAARHGINSQSHVVSPRLVANTDATQRRIIETPVSLMTSSIDTEHASTSSITDFSNQSKTASVPYTTMFKCLQPNCSLEFSRQAACWAHYQLCKQTATESQLLTEKTKDEREQQLTRDRAERDRQRVLQNPEPEMLTHKSPQESSVLSHTGQLSSGQMAIADNILIRVSGWDSKTNLSQKFNFVTSVVPNTKTFMIESTPEKSCILGYASKEDAEHACNKLRDSIVGDYTLRASLVAGDEMHSASQAETVNQAQTPQNPISPRVPYPDPPLPKGSQIPNYYPRSPYACSPYGMGTSSFGGLIHPQAGLQYSMDGPLARAGHLPNHLALPSINHPKSPGLVFYSPSMDQKSTMPIAGPAKRPMASPTLDEQQIKSNLPIQCSTEPADPAHQSFPFANSTTIKDGVTSANNFTINSHFKDENLVETTTVTVQTGDVVKTITRKKMTPLREVLRQMMEVGDDAEKNGRDEIMGDAP